MRHTLIRILSVVGATWCLSTAGSTLIRPVAAQAQVDLGNPDALRRTLETQAGKRVKLKLVSGQDLDGQVGAIGSYAVTLTELAGMEFYDATVRLDQIAAVIVRVRGVR